RMNFLYGEGLTTQKLEEFKIGPIILREEAIFRREIKLEDKIVINVELLKASADFGRWSLRHNFLKEDGALAAVINLDGAWIDLEKRKMAVPNEFIQHVFGNFPKSPEFELIPEKKKQ
ncbi:MAG: thioesterase family protein, partial [Bacteroidota bacterium]